MISAPRHHLDLMSTFVPRKYNMEADKLAKNGAVRPAMMTSWLK